MAAMAKAGTSWNQEPKILLGFSCDYGAQAFGASAVAFPGPLSGIWTRIRAAGTQTICNTGTADTGLIHCAKNTGFSMKS